MICNYVTREDVNAILPGTPAGQENDLASVAVSYCAFGTSSLGTVTVGVKNMGTTSIATDTVHQKYREIADGSSQQVATFTSHGDFAFDVSSTTPLQSGATLYAVNAQGSTGRWYVTIQYYAHRPCTLSAMRHLLATVLSQVP